MAYCTNSQVLAEFKNLSWASSGGIASATVDQWITEADTYIDAHVSLKYSTPVSSSVGGAQLLRTISVWLVADRVQDTLKLLTGNANIDQSSIPEPRYRARAEKMLKEIVAGKIALAGEKFDV